MHDKAFGVDQGGCRVPPSGELRIAHASVARMAHIETHRGSGLSTYSGGAHMGVIPTTLDQLTSPR